MPRSCAPPASRHSCASRILLCCALRYRALLRFSLRVRRTFTRLIPFTIFLLPPMLLRGCYALLPPRHYRCRAAAATSLTALMMRRCERDRIMAKRTDTRRWRHQTTYQDDDAMLPALLMLLCVTSADTMICAERAQCYGARCYHVVARCYAVVVMRYSSKIRRYRYTQDSRHSSVCAAVTLLSARRRVCFCRYCCRYADLRAARYAY